MLLNFWRAAHDIAISEMIGSIKPKNLVNRFQYLTLVAVTLGIPSAMYYAQAPGRRFIVIVELGMLVAALALFYLFKMAQYPASRVASYQQEVAKLRRDLDHKGITESCILALSEFLSDMNRLQNEDVRSGQQLLEWQRSYQEIVQATYVLISKGISNTAALTFVAYPISEVRYWRGAFGEDHAKTKSILEKYMVKLNTIIQGHYQAMRQDQCSQQNAHEECRLTIAA